MKRLLKWEEITTDYATGNLLDYEYNFKSLQTNCNRFEQAN